MKTLSTARAILRMFKTSRNARANLHEFLSIIYSAKLLRRSSFHALRTTSKALRFRQVELSVSCYRVAVAILCQVTGQGLQAWILNSQVRTQTRLLYLLPCKRFAKFYRVVRVLILQYLGLLFFVVAYIWQTFNQVCLAFNLLLFFAFSVSWSTIDVLV